MKNLLSLFALLWLVVPSFGANPSYDAFIGTNGIIITSNPPQGRVIVDGRLLTNGLSFGGGDTLWTNEPAGRIHPITFTNRVEVQRVFTVGTNSSAAPSITFNSNDIFYGYRDLTKGERINPAFSFGIYSNAQFSRAHYTFLHTAATLGMRVHDTGGNFDSEALIGAAADGNGPGISLIWTNGLNVFVVFRNSMDIDGVNYNWPDVQGAAGTVLTNNGAGVLGWGTAGGGGTVGFSDLVWTNDGTAIRPRDSSLQDNVWFRNSDGSFFINTNVLMLPGVGIDPTTSATHWPLAAYFTTNAAPGNTTWQSVMGLVVEPSNQEYSKVVFLGFYDPVNTAYEAEIGVNAFGPNDNTSAGLSAHNENGNNEARLVLSPGDGSVSIDLNARTIGSYINMADRFKVDNEGDIVFIKSVAYLWPTVQGAAGSVLTNNGAGILGWGAGGGGGVTFADLIWTNNTDVIYPYVHSNRFHFGTAATNGARVNLEYYSVKKSLRQGVVTGTQWDTTNLGIVSVAFGSNNANGGFYASILGGSRNLIPTNNEHSVIAGGEFNTIGSGGHSFIGGGHEHSIGALSSNHFIGGGFQNTIDANVTVGSVIAGGTQNRVRVQGGFIGGGSGNDVRAHSGTIAGGLNNVAGDDVGAADLATTIGGGEANQTFGAHSTIGGGHANLVNADTGTNATIGGGLGNTIASMHATIAGGALNVIENQNEGAFIGGGMSNYVKATTAAPFAFIVSGVSNKTDAGYAAVVGFFQTNDMSLSVLIGAGANSLNNIRVSSTNLHLHGGLTILMTNDAGIGKVLTSDAKGSATWQNGGSAPAILSGTTNFINLSVQAAKLPATNYAFIDAGWQAWETVYSETNAEGSRVNLSSSWQFMVPTDYATNSLKLLINYSLSNTNGPNTSNVVWGASIIPIRSGTTNNIHTNVYGTVVKGSNDWIAKYDGTNIVTNLVLDLSVNSLLMARDLCIIKLERFPTEDTYGGAVAVHGLQVEYTRP